MGSEEFSIIFSSLFAFFLFVFVFVFFSFSSRTRANDCNLLREWEFHSDPVCTDPVQNFPISAGIKRLGAKN